MAPDHHTQPSYQGISRKYRPQTFASVVGQDAIVTTLKNALRLKKTAHAYLFCGTRGTGKTTLARVLAKALNCQKLTPDCEPCNECTSCLEVMQGRSLNVFEIDGASNRGIDDIRQLNETIGYAPASGGYKIYIIDEVHMLTKEAFNALLKTLEEPPPNVKFFFATTEPHKVLSTIISRCQRFDLQRIPSQKVLQKLVQIACDIPVEYEEEALQMIAGQADGSMRVAESLFDQILCFSQGAIRVDNVTSSLGILSSDSFFELDVAFEKHQVTYAFSLTEAIFSSGKDFSYFLESLLEHYRNILAAQLKQPMDEMPSALQKKYQASAAIYTQEQCFYILDYLIHWHQQISKTPFKRISVEMILLHILRSKQRVSVDSLVRKLKELEHTFGAERPSESVPVSVQQNPHLEKDEQPPLLQPTHKSVSGVSDHTPIPPAAPVQEEPLSSSRPSIDQESKFPSPTSQQNTPAPQTLSVKAPEPIVQELFASIEAPKTASTALQMNEEKSMQKNITISKQIKYDTLMRFASVELEGILTKESI
jgi:DNA polymerase III subunit gamma/tau